MSSTNENPSVAKNVINWYPGHMAKTKKEIASKLPIIDLVYELVDARIPYSSRIVNLDKMINNKPRIIIFTKTDLCDMSITNKWAEKYRAEGNYVVMANLSDSNDYKKVLKYTEEIANDINEKRIAKGLKEKQLKALVVGVPNVGKSTFINKMAGRKVTNVGNKPGVTTNLSWLNAQGNILLLDTPGILWPKIEENEVAFNLASMAAISSDVVPIDEVAIYILNKLDKYYNNILVDRYHIDHVNNDDILETYDALGKRLGCLIRGGEVDYKRVSTAVVNDMKNELIKGITFDRL